MKLVLDSCPETSIYPFLKLSFHLDALLESLCDNEMRLPATLPLEINEKHSLLLFRYLTTAVPPHHPYASPFQDEHLGLLSPVVHQHCLKPSTSVVHTIYLSSLVKWDYVLLEKRKHFTFASLCYALDSEPSSMGY